MKLPIKLLLSCFFCSQLMSGQSESSESFSDFVAVLIKGGEVSLEETSRLLSEDQVKDYFPAREQYKVIPLWDCLDEEFDLSKD